MNGFKWYPHPGPQQEFCARGEFEVLYGGAAGGGKSDCLIMELSRDVWHSRYHGLLLRRTFPQLQELIDRCLEWYPQIGGEYRASEHRFYWENGARITLGHMQHENDKYNYQGKEFHKVGIDEVTQFTGSQYLYLFSRVRRSNSELGLQFLLTTNPGGIGHLFFKKRFIDVAKPGQTYIDPETGTSRVFIPSTVYDNPSIMENDPLYIRRLEALPHIEKMRLLHGVWDVFEGQAFTELSQIKHGADSFKIPAEWPKIMVFDWGYARPWCALYFTVDYDNVAYLYKAFYGMGKNDHGEYDPNIGLRQTNDQICAMIREHERGEKINTRLADPACWGPTKIKGSNVMFGPSFAEDAMRHGLFFLKADNDRLRGKQQLHMRLQMEEEIDRETGEILNEQPRMIVFKEDENGPFGVKRWWEEIQNLREDEKNPEDVDTEQPDEGYDCTRYFCMFRPVVPKKIETIPQGTFQAERARYIRAKQYAKRHGTSLAAAYGRVR